MTIWQGAIRMLCNKAGNPFCSNTLGQQLSSVPTEPHGALCLALSPPIAGFVDNSFRASYHRVWTLVAPSREAATSSLKFMT